ncbi:MAG: hypothetical protein Q6K99_10675, partial [Thermostichales cyanobacterium BF4_bins_65]
MLQVLQSLLGDPSERRLRDYRAAVKLIRSLELEMASLSAEQLRQRTQEFRQKIANATAGISDDKEKLEAERKVLDEILPEAFALVREAASRVLG